MTHHDFHQELRKLLYIEDPGMYDVLMASVVANSLQLGDPVWLTLIGASSAGKSQIIRPFAIGNPNIHQIDDLTENSLLSGAAGDDKSFLTEMGDMGILSMDDLTVLFSKSPETRQAILSQFRMLYDGRLSKTTGTKGQLEWSGYLGMIAGSTPSIYRFFGEVADMGERFVSYRMKAYDRDKVLEFVLNNPMKSSDRDEALAELIKTYLQGVLAEPGVPELSDAVQQELKRYAQHCTLLRTPIHIDERMGLVDEFPEPEFPTRVMNQMAPLAKALGIVQQQEVTVDTLRPVLWIAWSLANDKRREFTKAVVGLDYHGKLVTDTALSQITGLDSLIVRRVMSSLLALGVVTLESEGRWRLADRELAQLVRDIDPPRDFSDLNV